MRVGIILKYLDEGHQASVYEGIRKNALARGIETLCIQGEPMDTPALEGAALFPGCTLLTEFCFFPP
jgi:hypothetical protein